MSLAHRFRTSIAGLLCITSLLAQITVPRLVRVNSTFHPANGAAASVAETAIFSVYASETGGAPLWQETQNVTIDNDGRYSLLLGATRNEGLPMELFASGEQRWLGVQFQRPGEVEQPRVLLASVPYALKAVDAETLGGKPASAYLLNPSAEASTSTVSGPTDSAAPDAKRTPAKPAPRVIAPSYIPMYADAFGTTTDSVMYQNGSLIGLNTTNPLDFMHVVFTDSNGLRTGLAVQNTSGAANAYSGMLFYDQNGALGQFQGFNNSTHEYRINNIAKNGSNQFNGSINFMVGSSSKFMVRSDGDVDIPGSIRKGGALFFHNLGVNNTGAGLGALSSVTTGTDNTATGNQALFSNGIGNFNTASGFQTLYHNTTGISNTAFGSVALFNNIDACCNTAIGDAALYNNTNGMYNTASGDRALFNNVDSYNTADGYEALYGNTAGSLNTASGYQALFGNTGGYENTAVGAQALYSNTTGLRNTALGITAGSNITTGSYNIDIGNDGNATDGTAPNGGVIRIGTGGKQTSFFAAGIANSTVSGVIVLVDTTTGQLGTVASSRHYKEDIQDMGDTSNNLLRLRPVSFRYKQPYADGSKPLDYGLVAEEVAEIYPDLVVRNKDGQIETVQYQKLTPMLLNELQKQSKQIEQQAETIRHQSREIDDVKAEIAALRSLVLRTSTAPPTGQ